MLNIFMVFMHMHASYKNTFLIINIIIFLNISLLAKQLEKYDFPNNISLADKIYTYSTIWNEIKYNFVNIEQIKFTACPHKASCMLF